MVTWISGARCFAYRWVVRTVGLGAGGWLGPLAVGRAEIPPLDVVEMLRFAAAGLLVGFGTRLGSGCTSGHGVCGMARLSGRSIVATAIFVGIGMIVATALAS